MRRKVVENNYSKQRLKKKPITTILPLLSISQLMKWKSPLFSWPWNVIRSEKNIVFVAEGELNKKLQFSVWLSIALSKSSKKARQLIPSRNYDFKLSRGLDNIAIKVIPKSCKIVNQQQAFLHWCYKLQMKYICIPEVQKWWMIIIVVGQPRRWWWWHDDMIPLLCVWTTKL